MSRGGQGDRKGVRKGDVITSYDGRPTGYDAIVAGLKQAKAERRTVVVTFARPLLRR